ncbi:hypothetical protein KUCAC02_034416 [Chaenocephalus aceratus]|nr:hypothetical protein KUCAC02_034416 [Chaenocephalus aceratus]
MRLLCALGLFSALLHVTSCLLIGAFNIQRFGDKKSQNKEVMDIITQIIDRYDIILIQEVLDPDWKFRNISSEPLPLDRIGHKERYLFLYRHNKVSVKGSFQYDECKAGDFDRPPFVVQFSSTQTGVDFVLIPIHTSPSTADEAAKRTEKSKDGYVYKSTVEQLNALVDVVDAAKRKLENNNIVVLGDFNAGSNYVRNGDWKNIRLFTNKNFHWLINDVATTLAEKTIQTHDRIVVTTEMNEGVVKAEVFDFREAYHLKEAKKVFRCPRMRLLCALGLFSALLHVTSCLLIGAFNIQCFGTRKSQNKEVMDIITQIVLRYDIILIQEVRDKDGTVTQRLMDLVNHEPLPLGPGSHKERYLFLYKHQTVSVNGSFQYDEGKRGDFSRPPFVVQFSSTQTAVTDFVLIPIHTSPSTAVEELKALVDVVKEAKRKWQNNNIMALGDFNAGSNYVPMYKRPTIPLFDLNVFHWLIGNYVDTTVSGSIQAYDRIVVTDDMYKGMSPRSAGIFDFTNQYALTLDEAKAVSDHFPVEVELS